MMMICIIFKYYTIKIYVHKCMYVCTGSTWKGDEILCLNARPWQESVLLDWEVLQPWLHDILLYYTYNSIVHLSVIYVKHVSSKHYRHVSCSVLHIVWIFFLLFLFKGLEVMIANICTSYILMYYIRTHLTLFLI